MEGMGVSLNNAMLISSVSKSTQKMDLGFEIMELLKSLGVGEQDEMICRRQDGKTTCWTGPAILLKGGKCPKCGSADRLLPKDYDVC